MTKRQAANAFVAYFWASLLNFDVVINTPFLVCLSEIAPTNF